MMVVSVVVLLPPDELGRAEELATAIREGAAEEGVDASVTVSTWNLPDEAPR